LGNVKEDSWGQPNKNRKESIRRVFSPPDNLTHIPNYTKRIISTINKTTAVSIKNHMEGLCPKSPVFSLGGGADATGAAAVASFGVAGATAFCSAIGNNLLSMVL